MIASYIELGKILVTKKRKFMVVEGGNFILNEYVLIDVDNGCILHSSSNINHLRELIGEITTIK